MLAAIIIIALILATVAAAAFLLAPRLHAENIVYATRPDAPCKFGYAMGWLAIRTRDTERVARNLGLGQMVAANWDNGIGTIYSDELSTDRVFVSPPVNGWTFVVGLALPQPLGKAFIDKTEPLLLDLGNEFIEVQYFLAYPALDCFAWARVLDSRLVRAYAVSDQTVVWNKGKPTKEERALGTKAYEMRGVASRRGDSTGSLLLYPTEQHVMHLAARWSIDPTTLPKQAAEQRLGVIGTAPPAWRPERLRRTA